MATCKLVPEPLHIVASPDRTEAIGPLFTETIALPVRSPAIEVQFASLNAVTIKVFVLAGLTVGVYGFAVIPVTLTGVVPSEYVMFHGDSPVNAMLIVVEPPLHIVEFPLTTPVGRVLTVTFALPVRSPAIEVQFSSLNAVTV